MEKGRPRGSLVLLVLLLAIVSAAFWQRQSIYDWLRLRNYQPSPPVVALADATTMNPDARRLFYVYHPSLESRDQFNTHCTNTERTIVLGCYVQSQGIYVFDVTDPRLNGIEEVTAAHEMLHAAYDRLSSKERGRIDALTAAAFSSLQNDRIKSTIEQYRQHDASVVPNELHSILGTEVLDLPQDLETYYRRYFTDRHAVVMLSEQYQQAFTERQDKIDAYDKQLQSLKEQIEALQASLKTQEDSLVAERARLDTLRTQKKIEEYNASVPGFNAQVRSYNDDVVRTRKLIDEYNTVVSDRNALATEENELIKAIDSRPTTIETQ